MLLPLPSAGQGLRRVRFWCRHRPSSPVGLCWPLGACVLLLLVLLLVLVRHPCRTMGRVRMLLGLLGVPMSVAARVPARFSLLARALAGHVHRAMVLLSVRRRRLAVAPHLLVVVAVIIPARMKLI